MNSYRNILLIEDDPAVANSLIDGLEEANFQVVWKMNGRRASRTPAIMIRI
jgi:DNA-binding response OmpR family regulator